MLAAMCLVSPSLAGGARGRGRDRARGRRARDAMGRREGAPDEHRRGGRRRGVRRAPHDPRVGSSHPVRQALGVSPTVDAVAIVGRQESGAVEERLQRMVAAAAHASPDVQKAVREAYVLYYKAKGPGPKPPETLADLKAKPVHVRQAQQDEVFGNLLACIERLTAAIVPELRDN